MRSRSRTAGGAVALLLSVAPLVPGDARAAEEFCLAGEFDLGARYQGLRPAPGEFNPATWCVVTEDDADRVRFDAAGRSNPDLTGDFTVAYLPPHTVRIVNRGSPPDLQFEGADIVAEALRYRRIDPRRLAAELEAHPEWIEGDADGWLTVRYPGDGEPVEVRLTDGRPLTLRTHADLPLRGRVPVVWDWSWPDSDSPGLELRIDGVTFFRARGRWRTLAADAANELYTPSGNQPPRTLSGDNWPARIDMRIESIDDATYLVTGVRTGFRHLVADTAAGLVVSDAPAGWVELPQIPPVDLVPGLGVSGLSERLIDFLAEELPGRPIRAVALTHAHDDHAGGARAFRAAGADVYAPAGVGDFLTRALNRADMPSDRLARADAALLVRPVGDRVRLEDAANPVELVAIGPGPHAAESLGVWLPEKNRFFVSDLHVPVSDADRPRAERAATECWFARWATANLPPDAVVINSHSAATSPVSRLGSYLESDLCR